MEVKATIKPGQNGTRRLTRNMEISLYVYVTVMSSAGRSA